VFGFPQSPAVASLRRLPTLPGLEFHLDEVNMGSASSYTFERPEQLLAHYTDASGAFEHILPSRRLRMSPYRKMRDPAENKDFVFEPALERSESARADAVPRVLGMDVVATFKSMRDATRVLCFTLDARDDGDTFECSWARPRMWEQYADAHCGTCLTFDHEGLLSALTDRDRMYAASVQYTRGGIAESGARRMIHELSLWRPEPIVRRVRGRRDPRRLLNRVSAEADRLDQVADLINRYRDDFFFLKGDDFETEHEFRVVLFGGQEEEYAYIDFNAALVSVILGERFPDWQVPGAVEACRAAGVPLRRMRWEGGRPSASPV
jgi:hypothetical protein